MSVAGNGVAALLVPCQRVMYMRPVVSIIKLFLNAGDITIESGLYHVNAG